MNKILFRSFLIAFLSAVVPAGSFCQNITTYAGTGSTGSSGDGGAATAATMSSPHGVAMDAAGNIYIADAGNNKVRKITPSGTISTIAGTGTAGYNGDGIAANTAQLNNPFDVAVDAAGSIYIAETAGNRVRKITEGVIRTIAGTGVAGYSGDGGPATAAMLRGCGGMTLDAAGNVYVSDGGNHRIRKISTTGTITLVAGNGTAGYSGDGGDALLARLYYPGFLCFDPSGNLIISDNGNNRIRRIDATGNINTILGTGATPFGGDGGPATAATVYGPSGVRYNHEGYLFVSDCEHNRIRIVSPTGTVSTFAGTGTATSTGDGGPAASATLNKPTGLVFDTCGKLYIVERNGQKLRKVEYANRASMFGNGASVTVTMCATTADTTTFDSTINTRIAVIDTDLCQTITWSVIDGPAHGTVTGFPYSATANGGAVHASGVRYNPSAAYTGWDTVKIMSTDGTVTDTIVYYVQVLPCTVNQPDVAMTQNEMKVYPNPSYGDFGISLPTSVRGVAQVTITDIAGRKLKQYTMTGGSTQNVVLDGVKGMLIIYVQTNEQKWVQKVSVR
jgi:sugar lactone lactonase YvrE